MASPLEYLLKNPRDRHLENPEDFFEKRIRPVLVRHCYECHSSASRRPKGGLLLDSRERIRRGGDSGPAVVPGNLEESLLLSALRHESLEMPPAGKLPESVIRDFEEWVRIGAPDPRDRPPDPDAVAAAEWEELYRKRRRWWSFQPVTEPPPPAVRSAGWSADPIDRFILARLETSGLEPAPPADATTLIRRLAFALTGLPPEPGLVEEFLSESDRAAWERLVDRMLASPHFGERWARHWMDVVRYTDTYGYEWDIPAKGAWRYRDYLIRAFNQDVPVDQFLREQIAGDLLERPRIDPGERINESLIGPMFFQMGEKRHGDSSEFNGIHQEMIDNKIDAFSKAFQALTVSCSRCHDHKLDPISQRDYYALAGVFMSSRWVTNTVDLKERNAAQLAKLEELKRQLRPLLAGRWSAEAKQFAAELLAAQRSAEEPALASDGSSGDAESITDGGRASTWARLIAGAPKEESRLEDLLNPWRQVAAAVKEGSGAAAAWNEIATRYREESRRRREENARDFTWVADFREGVPDGWSIDGAGLRDVVRCGDFTVATSGPSLVHRLLPGGLFTNSLSPRLNGAVRSPLLSRFGAARISVECSGGDFAAHRTVVDNAFLTEKQRYLASEDPQWVRSSTTVDAEDRRIYIELATKTSNPNFPPRVGLGGECTEEQAADPRSWFGLTRVAVHETDASPRDELGRFAPLFEGPPAATLDEVAARYSRWFGAALEAWGADQATEDDVRLVNWLLSSSLLTNRYGDESWPRITELVRRYREIEEEIPVPCTVNGMLDHDPARDYPLNVRGDYNELGERVPRGFPRILSSIAGEAEAGGSGRRELAELVASATNPLTARVFVNRVWHWMFGTGLVATPNNFGLHGEQPSHPELLDHLAARFVAEGWSLKRLVRAIACTRTWRQSSRATRKALEVDPYSRLLSYYPLRRLEAESLRDAMLATSGRLDPRLYGPAISPYRQNEDPQKRLFSGPLDGDGRRSIYTRVTIMEPPRFLATFNQPDPKIPIGARDVTSTAAQSLALMNGPFVHDQAERWAKRLVTRPDGRPAARLAIMFRLALARKPTSAETARWSALVEDLAAAHGVPSHEVMGSVSIWKDVAHAIYNTKEFIHVR